MSAKKMPVGLDVDDVLIYYKTERFLLYCRDRLGWTVNLEAFAVTHSWPAAIPGIEANQCTAAFNDFIQENPDIQMVIPGAYEALQSLSANCSWHCITARDKALSSLTISVLYRGLPGIRIQSWDWRHSQVKARAILRRGIVLIIEDSSCEIETMCRQRLNVRIIQFPALQGQPQRIISDSRVIRLAACDEAPSAITSPARDELWRKAWQQAAAEVRQLLPTLSPCTL